MCSGYKSRVQWAWKVSIFQQYKLLVLWPWREGYKGIHWSQNSLLASGHIFKQRKPVAISCVVGCCQTSKHRGEFCPEFGSFPTTVHLANQGHVARPQQKLANGTRGSQAVSHPSTNLAQCCLTSGIGRELVFSAWYGRWHGLGLDFLQVLPQTY